MADTIRVLRGSLPLAVVLALSNLAACRARPAPTMVTVDEQAFSFQVPSDWFPAEFDNGAKAHSRKKEHQVGALKPDGHLLYASPRGDYVYLEFDPGGHGLEFDLEWTVERKEDRLVLIKEGTFCTPPPPDFQGMDTCLTGDGALLIQVAPWSLELRSHHYFIQFGNLRREQGVDHQVFRDILASFRAK